MAFLHPGHKPVAKVLSKPRLYMINCISPSHANAHRLTLATSAIGFVHGGAVASALDDMMGTTVWREVGYSATGVPTMELTVRYRRPVPMDQCLRFDARLLKVEGRKVGSIGGGR